jgi:WD40 repeat protein
VNAITAFELDSQVRLATSSSDHTLRIWDPHTGHQQIGEPLTGHTNWVEAITAFELDGQTILASGGDDATVLLWRAPDGTPTRQ